MEYRHKSIDFIDAVMNPREFVASNIQIVSAEAGYLASRERPPYANHIEDRR